MEIFESVFDKSKFNSCVLAFGNFDGVHIGHQYLLDSAGKYARENNMFFGVYTFADSPKFANANHSILTTLQTRLSLLDSTVSPDFVYLEKFGDVRDMSAEQFVEYIIRKFNCECGFCGENFRFGKGAEASSESLVALMNKSEKNAVIVPSVTFDGEVVSSSRICTLLKNGNVEEARKMGTLFGFESKVIHGAHLGNKLGFPTINQVIPDQLIHPKFGVYSVLVVVDGREYMGVTNFGVKPTVSDENTPVAETYIIDFEGDIYDKSVAIRFVKRLRDERQFSSLDELKNNISENVAQTKKYFEEYYENH